MILGTLFTALGYIVGICVFYLRAREKQLATQGFGYLAAAGFGGGILGAKLTQWLVAQPQVLLHQPEALLGAHSGGRTLLGGVIFGWVSIELAKGRLGIRRSSGDLFALALPAGEAVGRIGCFFHACCHGITGDAAWACYQHGQWRHPVQLYSALYSGALFILLWVWRDRLRHEGRLFALYLMSFGTGRFVLEFWRAHEGELPTFSTAQWLCLVLVAVGATLWRRCLSHHDKAAAVADERIRI
ncbi:MAG TPA: prolipoprotein diacylglyceryl transferase family protein [Abditibacteriaceae bacterium]